MDGGRLFTMDTDYVSSSFYKIRHSLFRFYNHLPYFLILITTYFLWIYYKENIICNGLPSARPTEDLSLGAMLPQQEVQLLYLEQIDHPLHQHGSNHNLPTAPHINTTSKIWINLLFNIWKNNTSSPNFEKFAERIDGDTIISFFENLSTRELAFMTVLKARLDS